MTKEAKEKILKIIEKNSRLTNLDLAVMLDLDPTDVATALKQMEEDKVICGYHTL
ncbi:winged helix-turn-helix transcriptional regulator, partial [Jeotgalibaca porci]|uniref:winged helix-turn-helix transcriptional regulator n=1 Tax=Jeotgalibaca porci TaxID=1868793 RepID=UPI0035A05FA0